MMKFIEGWYFLSIGAVAAGIYLMILYIILGDIQESLDNALHTGFLTAATLWFRNRYKLKP